MTADKSLGLDAVDFFKNMAIGNLNGKYAQLLQAPTSLKQHFMTLLEREIEKGEDGYVFAKFNSLTDKDFIDKFMEASQKGVKIDLVIRGISCLLPGIAGLTDNIEIHSIVGRFLEHTRLYIFGKGAERDFYISSADLMTRNTERRVEVAVPIYDEEIREQLLAYSEVVFRDNVKGRKVNPDGVYEFLPEGDGPLSSQDYCISVGERKATFSTSDRTGPEDEKKTKKKSWFRKVFGRSN